MPRPLRLPRPFPSRDGVPTIARVDRRIFTLRYFTHCLQCGFCHDWCCQFGVDVEIKRARAILRRAGELERYVGIPRARWFEPEVEADSEMPGGAVRRTRVEDGHCVFLRRDGRGCLLHAFALERGMDYHAVKSMVDCLFPLTFGDGLLGPADEILDGELVCAGQGPTLYRGVREEVRYYFGDECIAALDEIEARVVRVCA
jgi:hypothetical protein